MGLESLPARPGSAEDESLQPWGAIVSPRLVALALLSAALLAVATAIPTAIIENPWFTRMTPVYGDQYVFWVGTSLLGGSLIASYLAPVARGRAVGTGMGGGLLGYLAIGCPICNKVIVGLVGASSALDYFAPTQPVLGGLGLLLVGLALRHRLRDLRRTGCPVPGERGAAAL